MKKISIVVPCYNEEESIPLFYNELKKVFDSRKEVLEIIYVDDGSSDKSLKEMKKIASSDKNVRYISFSRNFGKEAAMYAGLSHATGDYITIMDVDLQDPPEKLVDMYQGIKEEGYDCVALYTKSHKGYNFMRKGLTKLWYKLIDKMSASKQTPGARDFRLMTRQMVDALISMPEYNRYTKGMFGFVGFNTKWISYEAPNRKVGKSKFNLRKLIKYAMEGITSSSTAPLLLSTYIGLFFCLIAFIAIVFIIVKTVVWGDPVSGWPSMTCIILLVSGVQLFFLGVIGTYISKIYLEVKNRPVYIIKEDK